MIANQADQVTPELKPKARTPKVTPEIQAKLADACSCTTCDSLGCFTCRRNKCCSFGRCTPPQEQPKNTATEVVDPKTSIVYEKKIEPKESHSNSSEFIASIKKALSIEDCVCGKVGNPTMDKFKYSDLENRLKDKLERVCKPNKELCRPAPVDTGDQVATVKNTDKGSECVGTKLSAQIMNLSYKDFKQSLSYNRSDTSSFKMNKLSKYDIFQKIKEVYKACSCKVCECLVGKTTRNELCKCKPCDCIDCMSYVNKFKQLESRKSKDCCGCKQYEKTFAGIAKKLNDNKHCSCKPCDCIECAADYLMKPCRCDPCACIECRSMYVHNPAPVIVAPVVDESQRNLCQCSPCECIECGRRYGLPSNLVHEMSTGTNRPRHTQCHCGLCQNEACEPDGVGSCKCDRRNRVMSKPVEKDAHDFDIRTVLINNPIIPKYKHDTIAMFAALSNICPNFKQNNTEQCICGKYDCLGCSYREDAINAIKSSQLFTPAKLRMDKSRLNTDACKYQPCECEMCNKYNGRLSDRQKQCLCNICDCLKCRRHNFASTTKNINKSECICRQCEHKYHKINSQRDKQHLHDTCMICKRCLQNENLDGELDCTTKSASTSQDTSFTYGDSECKIKPQLESLSVYQAFPTIDFPRPTAVPKSKSPSFGAIGRTNVSDVDTKRKRKIKAFNILKCDAYTQYKKRNKSLYKSNSMVYKNYGSYYSDSSSIKTNSKSSSFYKDNGSVTPVSVHKDKSCLSSCNSSGYDYPDYLVQFPKSTVETCLKDVLKLNLDKNIKIDKLNIAPSSPNRKRFPNSASYENTIGKYKQYYKDGKLKRKTCKNEDTYTPLQRSYSKKVAAYTYRQRGCTTNSRDNISMYKIKNKCTQTGDQGDHESTSRIRNDGYETERSNRRNSHNAKNMRDLKISRNLYDYSVISHEVPKMTQNDQFPWKRTYASPFTNFPSNFFKIDDDYKRIQKTLQEAKVFSADLMKILEKYEKDNREFVSVSEKLRRKHMALLNCSHISETKPQKDIYDAKPPFGELFHKNQHSNDTEHELRQIHLENPSTEENISLQVFPKRIASQEESSNVQQTLDVAKFNNKNVCVMVILPQENANVGVKSNQNDASITAEKLITKKENETPNREVPEVVRDLNIRKRYKGTSYKRVHRYNKLIKRTVPKKICANIDKNGSNPPVISAPIETCNTSIKTTAVGQSIKINDTADRNVELNKMRQLDAVSGNTTEISVCTSNDKMYEKKKNISVLEESTAIQTQDIEGRKPWPILKKNFSLVSKAPATKSKGVYMFPSLQLEVKEVVESISLKTRNKVGQQHVAVSQSQHKDNHPTNKTVDVGKMLDITTQPEPARDEPNVRKDTSSRKTEDIERQVKELLNSSLVQPIMKKLLNSDSLMKVINSESRMPRIESSKSSCEALKASFLGVRRVSDHTVLVKWNLPREVTDVQGYELLVDGRAVQKSFSPSKCMAVITCLPHADKVLLTIRTITALVARTGHYPAASIIYRPRIK